MASPPSVDVLYTSYLDLDVARLGRLVTSVDDPHQCYYPFDDVVADPIYRQPAATNVLLHIGNAHWVGDAPSSLAGTHGRAIQPHLLVHADRITTFVLPQHEFFLHVAADLPGAATWIKEQFQLRRHVFMIVGYVVAEQSDLEPEDLDAGAKSARAPTGAGGAQVDMALAPSAAGQPQYAPSPIGVPANTAPPGPQVAGLVDPQPQAPPTAHWSVPGPAVINISYREVHFDHPFPQFCDRDTTLGHILDVASAMHAGDKSVDPSRFKLGERTHSIAYLPGKREGEKEE